MSPSKCAVPFLLVKFPVTVVSVFPPVAIDASKYAFACAEFVARDTSMLLDSIVVPVAGAVIVAVGGWAMVMRAAVAHGEGLFVSCPHVRTRHRRASVCADSVDVV